MGGLIVTARRLTMSLFANIPMGSDAPSGDFDLSIPVRTTAEWKDEAIACRRRRQNALEKLERRASFNTSRAG
jgi:hypothetical protein